MQKHMIKRENGRHIKFNVHMSPARGSIFMVDTRCVPMGWDHSDRIDGIWWYSRNRADFFCFVAI